MAAPDGIVWGDIKGSYGRIGLYVSISNTEDLKSNVTIQAWFWSKYKISDSNNTYKFDNESTNATTNLGDVNIDTTVGSGSGWDERNQILISTHTYSYDRTSTARTIHCAAKLSGVDKVSDGGTMSVSTSYTIPSIPVYTIEFDANGGTGAPASQIKTHGSTLVISDSIPVRNGFTFLGWNPSASATSATYSAGGNFTANASVTLYAIWASDTIVISFNANGGTGAPASQTKVHGQDLKLSTVVPTRAKYRFLGWSISSSSVTVAYAAGGVYSGNSSITLYAVWESAYSRPRLSVTTLYRSAESEDDQGEKVYTQSDVGTFFTIKVYYEVDAEPVLCKIEWRPSGGSSWSEAVTHDVSIPSGTYGNSSTLLLNLGNGEVAIDKTYYVRVTVFDVYDNSSIMLTLPGTKYAIDFLAGGNGAAFGKPAETEGMLEIDWITRINAIVSAEDISADGSILASKGEFDTLEASTSISSPLGTFTRLYDAKGTKYSNGIASYGGSSDPINPDTTLEHLVLTNTNTPNGGFMFIKTEFYQSKSESSNRVQTALPYNSDGCPYMRRYYNNAWTSWVPLHAGKADVVGGSTLGTITGSNASVDTTGNKNNLTTWTVPEDGVYAISANAVWASNSTGYRMLQLLVYNASGTQVGKSIAYVRQFIAGGSGIAQNISGFRRLTKNHKVILHAAQNSGGALNISTWTLDIVKISP